MHILVVTQYFWPENFRINDLVTGLHERGHRISVLTGHPNYPSGRFFKGYSGKDIIREQYEGVQVVRVPLLPRGSDSGIRLALNYISFAISGTIFGLKLFKDQYDLIFVYEPSPMTVGFPAMALKRKLRRPIAFYIQDLWPESLSATGFVTQPTLLKLVERMVKTIYNSCDKILVTSRAFIPRVERLGYNPSNIHYFPQYAEDFYKPLPPNDEWALSQGIPDGFRIIFAGNMGSAQDLDNVVKAAKLTKGENVSWIFVGDGSAKSDLQEYVTLNELDNVYFFSSRPSDQMPAFFAQASALLVSLTSDELFALTVPAKLQSYLASGKPILASLAGEGANIVQESGSGIVVPPGDSEALAHAALQLRNMTEAARAEMGQRGRQYFERHFEREAIISDFEELFNKMRSLI